MTAYTWTCACGESGRGEEAARRHANNGCTLSGYPRGWNPDRVWVDGHWAEAS